MKKLKCPYCLKWAEYIDSIQVFRKSYGMIYFCGPCDARIGADKETGEPIGTMANADLRKARMRAHEHFDPIWKNKEMTRTEAYGWLGKQLNITVDKCHIARFDLITCINVIAVCTERKL